MIIMICYYFSVRGGGIAAQNMAAGGEGNVNHSGDVTKRPSPSGRARGWTTWCGGTTWCAAAAAAAEGGDLFSNEGRGHVSSLATPFEPAALVEQ